jgi:hypothetical protein
MNICTFYSTPLPVFGKLYCFQPAVSTAHQIPLFLLLLNSTLRMFIELGEHIFLNYIMSKRIGAFIMKFKISGSILIKTERGGKCHQVLNFRGQIPSP